MRFEPTSEQAMLRESVRRFVDERWSFDQRTLASSKAPDNRGAWKELADLGWLAAALPESHGGLGGGPIESALLLEAFGRGFIDEPVLESAVWAARALIASGCSGLQQRWLPAIAEGRARLAVAYEEAAGAHATMAQRTASGFRVQGTKIAVVGGGTADALIVSAQLDGSYALFMVNAGADGVECRGYPFIDNTPAADVLLEDVEVPADALLVAPGAAVDVLEEGIDHAIVGLCAGLLGSMEKGLELTIDYLKQRRQFGRPLAEFQALQHRIADLYIEIDTARSLVFQGLAALGAAPSRRRRAVSACKVRVVEAAKHVLGEGVHCHGGMGMTAEMAIGHFYRRALVAEHRFGSGAEHLQRYLDQETAAADDGMGLFGGDDAFETTGASA